MLRRATLIAALCAGLAGVFGSAGTAAAQGSGTEWDRMYHYPYVYYPHNFWGPQYFKGFDHPYYRYPPHMRIPVYNKGWFNFYPEKRKYHSGKHFILDVF